MKKERTAMKITRLTILSLRQISSLPFLLVRCSTFVHSTPFRQHNSECVGVADSYFAPKRTFKPLGLFYKRKNSLSLSLFAHDKRRPLALFAILCNTLAVAHSLLFFSLRPRVSAKTLLVRRGSRSDVTIHGRLDDADTCNASKEELESYTWQRFADSEDPNSLQI